MLFLESSGSRLRGTDTEFSLRNCGKDFALRRRIVERGVEVGMKTAGETGDFTRIELRTDVKCSSE